MTTLDCPVAAALTVIEQYARHDARLPSFPPDPPRSSFGNPENDAEPRPPTVLKVVATDKVAGGVLPRANDTWLAMVPFDDLDKSVSDAVKHDLIQKRRAFVEVLATVAHAGAPAFRLDASASMRCGGEPSVDSPSASNKTFWFDLMRALYPEASNVKIQEMTRSLIAMSHTMSLRFLFCASQEVVPADLSDMVEKLLTSPVDPATLGTTKTVLAACGVKSESVGRFTVEIGLSFTAAKIPSTFLTQLFDILDRCAQPRDVDQRAVGFYVTTLRFRGDCVFQAKALDVLGQRKTPSMITTIRLGDLNPRLSYDGNGRVQCFKPASLRISLRGVLSQQSGLRRLVMTSLDGFKPVASALRTTESHVEELDVAFEPTVENAAWLAFALFHVDSKSSVSSLRLRFPPNRHADARQWSEEQKGTHGKYWQTAFKRALRSTNADQDLACLEDGEEHGAELHSPPRRFVTIKAGTVVKAGPDANAKWLCKVEVDADLFEAIATVNKSLAVIVPGVGIGWVLSAKVMSEIIVASRLPSARSEGFRTNRKIRSLVWDSVYGSRYQHAPHGLADEILEILQIVGGPLQSLHLPSLSLSSAQLAQVLAYCPNLTDLNISGHAMTSIAPLVDAYASGSCKIHTLNVVSSAEYQRGSIPRELDTILQGTHGHTLQRLAVHVTSVINAEGSNITRHEDDILGLARTICTSQALSFVKMTGSAMWQIPSATPFHGDGRPSERVPPSKLAIDETSLPFGKAPMPKTLKLAFLSCLQYQEKCSALRRLDARVMALIFRLSGQRVARHVILDAPYI